MLVTIGYYQGDLDQAQRLSQWMKELGGCKRHTLLIARDREVTGDEAVQQNFKDCFDSVEIFAPTPDSWKVWPTSANNVYSCIARHVEHVLKAPYFMFIEPDVVPLRTGWLDELQAEYERAGKSFMGDDVNVADIPRHLSGVAIYPGQMSRHAGIALIAHETAWDYAAKDQILPQAHFTTLIEHAWKHPTFENWEHVEREVDLKNACLFHSSKDGSLIERLREHLNEGSKNPSGKVSELSEASACDIFIKTYPPDFKWLGYCLLSITKFAAGFQRTIIVTPEDSNALRDAIVAANTGSASFRIEQRFEYGMGNPDSDSSNYLSQQVFKLHADTFSDADFILNIDSDTILTQHVTPETYFKDGKIVWMMTPYASFEEELKDNPNMLCGVMAWKPITEKFLKQPVEFEFMRRLPVMLPRWIYSEFRKFCEKEHGTTLEEYVMSQPGRSFSEYNALGAYAYTFHRDKFSWCDTTKDEWPALTVNQKWSVGGLTEEIKTEFETILGGAKKQAEKITTVNDQPADASPKTLPTVKTQTFGSDELQERLMEEPILKPMQKPWQDRKESEREIKLLCTALAQFCGAPIYKSRVRVALRAEKIIK